MRAPEGDAGVRTQVWIESGTEEAPGLVRWSSKGPVRGGRAAGRLSYALRTPDGTVFIDPEWWSPDEADRLAGLVERMGTPGAGVVTSSWHERASYLFGEHYGIPVWLPRAGTAEMEGEPDRLFGEGDALPGGMRAVEIDDGFAGDVVFHWRTPGGRHVLFGGDVLLGGSGQPGHWREAPGLYAYMFRNPPEDVFRARLRRLLALEFDAIYSAHNEGPPFTEGAKQRLARLIEEGEIVPGSPDAVAAYGGARLRERQT